MESWQAEQDVEQDTDLADTHLMLIESSKPNSTPYRRERMLGSSMMS